MRSQGTKQGAAEREEHRSKMRLDPRGDEQPRLERGQGPPAYSAGTRELLSVEQALPVARVEPRRWWSL